jgi:hypothetical protein
MVHVMGHYDVAAVLCCPAQNYAVALGYTAAAVSGSVTSLTSLVWLDTRAMAALAAGLNCCPCDNAASAPPPPIPIPPPNRQSSSTPPPTSFSKLDGRAMAALAARLICCSCDRAAFQYQFELVRWYAKCLRCLLVQLLNLQDKAWVGGIGVGEGACSDSAAPRHQVKENQT